MLYSTFVKLPYKLLYDVMHGTKQSDYYIIHISGQNQPLQKKLESAHAQRNTFSKDITTLQFQAEMNRIGDRIFGVR